LKNLTRPKFIALLILLLCSSMEAFSKAQPAAQILDFNVVRIAPLTIRVIFVGPYFEPKIIDAAALESLLPKEKNGRILMDENTTGVMYKFDYEFIFAPSSFRTKLLKFLTSIEERIEIENPWFYTFEAGEEWFVTKPTKVTAAIYDARKVEEWLMENISELGGQPENGYTIIIADLRDLPSATYNEISAFLKARTFGITPPQVKAHYYKVNYVDFDRGYRLRYREFAIGWGGSSRFWFIDLSAGPTFVSMWYDLPIQVVMEDQSINPFTSNGAMWLTEYLADYIWEFIYNLAAPDFVYDPPWSMRFTIKISVIDCRSEIERAAVPIEGTVNSTLIEEAIRELLPLSEVDVEVAFLNISGLPELNALIQKYSGVLKSWIHEYLFLSPTNLPYVDAQPIYEYIKGNLNLFTPRIVRNESEYVIPIVAFAFSQDKHFMFKYKWLIAGVNPETRMIWGFSFREFALIGLSHRDFLYGDYVEPKQEGKGFGFSQAIIHEIGHMLGLSHPHTYGDLGDFVCSAMSYFSYEYGFSVFDKDALARMHADKLLIKAYKEVSKAKSELSLKLDPEGVSAIENLINEFNGLLAKIDDEYSRMNYVEAWRMALNAYDMARKILEKTESLPSIPREILRELEEKDLEIKLLNERCLELEAKYETLLSELSLSRGLIIALSIIVVSLTIVTLLLRRRAAPMPK